MNFISKLKRKFINKNFERELALEIVEIFNDKLEDLNVSLPCSDEEDSQQDLRIKGNVRKELISEIEDFIIINKKIFQSRLA